MNERIRELAKAAGLSIRGHYDESGSTPAEIKKFAELIVQECLSQVEKQYKPMLEDETMMKDTRWVYYVDCGFDINAAIREHFGVSNAT
jgi:hypothetical protein